MDTGIAIPIFPARDLNEARAFYERLGFRTFGWWPDEFGGYAILKRGDLIMHFSALQDISSERNRSQCYWRIPEVDAFYAECLAAGGTTRVDPVDDTPWGTREFSMTDPTGNLIRIGRPLAFA